MGAWDGADAGMARSSDKGLGRRIVIMRLLLQAELPQGSLL